MLPNGSETEVKKCTNCNHECHCNKEHIDEYLDICPCDNCNCKTKKEYENKLVFLMGIEKARFRNPVIPDCKLELNIEAIRSHGRVWKYKGEAFVEGKKMADAIWSATIVDKK